MGRKDWAYVNLPKLLLKRMDKFIESPQARQLGVFNKSELLRNLVNEFLVDQEKYYDSMESIDDFINEVEYGDHFAITFNDEKQFEEIVYAYARRGIMMNAINVLIGMKIDELRFLRALKKIKSVDSLFNSEKIFFISADDSINDGHFSIEPVLKRLDSLNELAKKKSMSGLFVQGYLAGKVIEEGGNSKEVLSAESRWHETAVKKGSLIAVLCLYSSLSKDLEELLSTCHHIILKRAITKTGLQ